MNRKNILIIFYAFLLFIHHAKSFAASNQFIHEENKKTIFIEVCGIDGAGKTTFVKDLKSLFSEKNMTVTIFNPLKGDPTFYPFLNSLDFLLERVTNPTVLKDIAKFKTDYFSLYFLTQAKSISVAAKSFDVIIFDRYKLSHSIYCKAFGGGTDSYNQLFDTLPNAHFTFLLDVPIQVALKRINGRSMQDSYETEEFLTTIKDLLLDELVTKPNIICLDGTKERSTNILEAQKVLGL